MSSYGKIFPSNPEWWMASCRRQFFDYQELHSRKQNGLFRKLGRKPPLAGFLSSGQALSSLEPALQWSTHSFLWSIRWGVSGKEDTANPCRSKLRFRWLDANPLWAIVPCHRLRCRQSDCIGSCGTSFCRLQLPESSCRSFWWFSCEWWIRWESYPTEARPWAQRWRDCRICFTFRNLHRDRKLQSMRLLVVVHWLQKALQSNP